MRRTAAIIAGSVAAALAAGGILTVSGGAQTSNATTIKLVTKDCTYKSIDVPPRSRGRESAADVGDGYTGSCPVLSPSGARAGALDYTCQQTKAGRRFHVLCETAYALTGGDLHTLARVDTSDGVSGSIVGGTGTYAGARGTFTSIDRPRGNERNGYPKDDTITLLP